jgi:uncharacterized protein (UPF0276 family)
MSNHINKNELPYLGFGLGLRTEHYESILAEKPPVHWFEIITENYLVDGGKPHYYLEKIRADYPLVMHGVSMSIGSVSPIDWDYLTQIKQLSKRIDAKWISDHLCFTGIHGINTHDLLPLPYTDESIKQISNRIKEIQDFFEQRILIENVSSYITYQQSNMTEWDFISHISHEADCFILLDINNIYVSAINHHFDPKDYLQGIPCDRVKQFHLAGHSNVDNYIIDTHDHDIITPVWDLYRDALHRFGSVSTMIERDDHIPSLSILLNELNYAETIFKNSIIENKQRVTNE